MPDTTVHRPVMSSRHRGLLVLAVAIVAAAVIGYSQLLARAGLTTNPSSDTVAVRELVAHAKTELPGVQVDERAPMTGYDRDLFGGGWAVRSGCDMRNRTLTRDLVDVVHRPRTHGCVVETGTLHDPYTGRRIEFQKGDTTSTLVQIDHRVPLALAWQQGAQQWSPERRETFANDPANLQSTDGSTNQQKGDSGPGSWLPSNEAYRCEYVARFVLVAAEYDLTVTSGDHAQIDRVLNRC